MNTPAARSFIIQNGQAVSNHYVDLEGRSLVALAIPTSYTGGNITFQASPTEGGTYNDVYDSNGTLVTISVGGADRVVALTGSHLQAVASLRFIKIKCTSAVTADRVITCISKG